MAVSEIINDLKRLISPANIERAGLAAFAHHHARIFEEGRGADGLPIGKYSTTPIYVNPARSPRSFSPGGKTGRTKFSDGRPHVSRYFPGGYRDFRSTVGRPTDRVNLFMAGDLSRSYVPGFVGRRYAYGFINLKSDQVADGNEAHFGVEIFAASEEEANVFVNTLTDFL